MNPVETVGLVLEIDDKNICLYKEANTKLIKNLTQVFKK